MNSSPILHPLRVALMPALLACAGILRAQTVVAPPPAAPRPAPTQAAGPSRELKGHSNIASAIPEGLPLLQRGPVTFRPHLQYRFIQANGVHATPVLSVDTSIQEFTPAMIVDIGKHWNLNYTPTWTRYSNEFFRDSFDQAVTLSGFGAYGHWTFGGTQSYAATNSALIETGGQTHQKMITTSANVGYTLGEHARVQFDATRGDRRVDAVDNDPQWTTANWLQWSGSGWLIYQFSERFMIGAGGTVGYDEISRGPDMSYSRPQVQTTWQPTKKVALHAQAGVERRRVEGGNADSMNNPIYSASLEYQPVMTTKFIGTVSRSVSASYYANRAIRMTGWSAGIQQRLLGKLYLTCDVNEGRTTYLATGSESFAGEILDRDDVTRSFNARLSSPFLRRGSVAVFYQLGRNHSDVHTYAFRSNQYGFEVEYSF